MAAKTVCLALHWGFPWHQNKLRASKERNLHKLSDDRRASLGEDRALTMRRHRRTTAALSPANGLAF
jgi:hypothetical protein